MSRSSIDHLPIIKYHPDMTNAGTFRNKDAKSQYESEVNGGTLTLQGRDWAESISNDNVAAVVTRPTETDEIQCILLVTVIGESTKNSASAEHHLEVIEATKLPQSFVEANSISPRALQLSRPSAEIPAPLFYIIISTLSGTGGAQHYFDHVLKPAFTAIGIEQHAYHVQTTDSNKSISNFASSVLLPRAIEGTPQTVVLLSGDGGIVDIINAVSSAERGNNYIKPAIGLIAMGTGNAFANSTGLNRDATGGLRHVLRGKPHSIPTFTAKFSPGSEYLVDEGRKTESLSSIDGQCGTVFGAVVCSWALHASLVADSDTAELRKFGSQRFQMAAKELLTPSDGSAPHAYKGKITLIKKDDHDQEIKAVLDRQEHMYILTTMVSNLEEKLTISPHSKPLDGQLRLLHFGPVTASRVMGILGLAFKGGQHTDDEIVGYDRVEGVRIDFDESDNRWRRVCVDGKIVRIPEGGWVEARNNNALDVLDIIVNLAR